MQSAIRHKKESVVKLLPKKDNPRDSNAICVVVQLDSAILPLGYIGVKKIPKVTKAMQNQQIETIQVKSITSSAKTT